jgi:16S rRNA (guanine527-N7)-methyltransferase
MLPSRISELLGPYVEDLSSIQLEQVSTYLEVLLRWNAKMNLTAIRDPEQIVTRHFGESFFLARHLPFVTNGVTDIGSGAGFPGIPIKILRPELTVTLVEAQQRKAVFLRESMRALHLEAEVKNVRAEEIARQEPGSAEVVTFRAVEKFESILPVAGELVRRSSNDVPAGTLAILIGSAQVPLAQGLLKSWQFRPALPVPGSQSRVILLGNPTS